MIEGKNIIRIIFLLSSLLVIALGVIVLLVFYDEQYRLAVHFDVARGVTTGSVGSILAIIGLVFFLHIINMFLFRIIYVRSNFLSYFLPALNAILALLLLMYILVIMALN